MSKAFLTRRDLLRYATSSAGLMMGARILSYPNAARAATGPRQHHICIHHHGGLDSGWGASMIPDEGALYLSAADRQEKFYGAFSGPRFPDAIAKAHPSNSSMLMGPVMSQYSNAELQNMLLIRGIAAHGGHNDGNRYVLAGHLSPYAAGSSTLIAEHLANAPFTPKLFHHVQLSDSDSGIAFPGLKTGLAVPTFIPDSATWSALTIPVTGDPTASYLAELKSLLTDLGNEMASSSNLKFERNRQMVKGYNTTAVNLLDIMGQRYATSQSFLDTVTRYSDVFTTAFIKICVEQPVIAAIVKNHPLFPVMSGGTITMDQARTFLKTQFGLDLAAWNFALTEFLVVNDLSAVVNNKGFGGDFHDFNDRDIICSTLNYAGVRELARALEQAKLPDGRSVLDVTLISLNTEFDRHIVRSPFSTKIRVGTDHGTTLSVMYWGHSAKGGILGDRMHGGHTGIFGTSKPFNSPLPMDLNTGALSSTGEQLEQVNVCSTSLYLFGIQAPPQQSTGAKPLYAARDPAKALKLGIS